MAGPWHGLWLSSCRGKTAMSIAACAEIVKRGDPDRFLAVMSAPPDLRGALFALYAFNVEIARAPWLTQEPMIARMRLQWWHDCVDGISAGQASASSDVAEVLADVIRTHDLPAALFHEMIDARLKDIEDRAFRDSAELMAHLDKTAGHLMWLAALCAGAIML